MLSVDAGLAGFGSANFYRLVVVGSASPKQVRANQGLTGTEVQATYGAGWVAGAEFHVVGVFTSSTSRAVYYNGALGASDTTSLSAPSVNQVNVGRHSVTGSEQYWSGTLGEQAVWNIALAADAIRRLYDPGTRFELWYPLRSRKWFTQAAGGDVTVALTGQASTASAGSVVPSSTVATLGQAATASSGTVNPNAAVATSGQAASASAGTLAPTSSKALSGSAATVDAGTTVVSSAVPLSGQAVAASAGTITYAADGNVTVALSGAAVTASAGALLHSRSVGISGSATTASAGTAVPGIGIPASGSQVSTAAGTLALGIAVPLSGQANTASAGTVTYSTAGTVSVALSGQAVTASAGTLVYDLDDTPPCERPIGQRLPGSARQARESTSARIRRQSRGTR